MMPTIELGGDVLSGTSDVWAIFRTLRDASPAFQLKPKVLQTLAAVISCLKPGKGLICFASNQELQRRLAGVSDKTIRRHIADLVAASIIRRQDSPNGKRYSSRDPNTGQSEAYGFDLSPLVENASQWQNAYEVLQREQQHLRHLRTKILARLAWIDEAGQQITDTNAARKILRRTSLSVEQAASMLKEIETTVAMLKPQPSWPTPPTDVTAAAAATVAGSAEMSTAAGQNDRHQSKSLTKDLETEGPSNVKPIADDCETAVLKKLERGCENAMQFAMDPIRSWEGIERHAAMLAPMIGIDRGLKALAETRFGTKDAALAILAMVELQPGIRNMKAYFRSLVVGRRAASFDPRALVSRLNAAHGQ